MGKLRSGIVYRYARPYSNEREILDGLPNYFYVAHVAGVLALLDKGISPIGSVEGPQGERYPAVLVSTSEHKAGTEDTPWQDIIDANIGYVKYFGDNKLPGLKTQKKTDPKDTKSETPKKPEETPGNQVLLKQLDFHQGMDPSKRQQAAPILVFERVRHDGRLKGNVRFAGYGVIASAERVTQYQKVNNSASGYSYFTNYVFEIALLALTDENEEFDWNWVKARADKNVSEKDCLKLAPNAWRQWVRTGQIEPNRRRVSSLLVKKETQQPEPKSRGEKCLFDIYEHYRDGRQHQFELLALKVSQQILGQGAGSPGWITKKSGDGGVDFVLRLEVGSGFASTRLVVLGQAKCEAPNKKTGGIDVARTVARLKRGWIGVYVTTGSFSDHTQREIIEDQYPLVTVAGKQLAEHTLALVESAGGDITVKSYLESLDVEYERDYKNGLSRRRPEEILFD
jgi:hypothetical protein